MAMLIILKGEGTILPGSDWLRYLQKFSRQRLQNVVKIAFRKESSQYTAAVQYAEDTSY